MGQPTITGFMIALTLIGFFVGIFGMLYSDMAVNYGVDYQNNSLAVYQDMSTIHAEAERYQEDIESASGEKNLIEKGIDIAGGILSAGITSLKISAQSFNVFIGMADEATDELGKAGIGETAVHLRAMIGTIVIILIFLGIILPVILRWGRKI